MHHARYRWEVKVPVAGNTGFPHGTRDGSRRRRLRKIDLLDKPHAVRMTLILFSKTCFHDGLADLVASQVRFTVAKPREPVGEVMQFCGADALPRRTRRQLVWT